MYLEKKYCDTNRVIIPQDLIIKPVNKVALPVYLTMYIMDNSTIGDYYNVPVTLKNICDRMMIFKDVQLRAVHYNMVADAIQWLVDRGYITVDNISRKSTKSFSYRFACDFKKVIKTNAAGKKQQFAYVYVKEIKRLFESISLSDKSWKFYVDVFSIYMYLKLKEKSWQYEQGHKMSPAWVGYLGSMYNILDISSQKVTSVIAWLKCEKIILPIYGAKEKNKNGRSETIIIFLACCDIQNLHKTIASIEIRLKEKNKDAHWYPAEITDTGAEFIDEAALDVVCDEDELY